MPVFENVVGYYILDESLEDESTNENDLVPTDDSPDIVYGPNVEDIKAITRGYVLQNFATDIDKDFSISFWLGCSGTQTDSMPRIYFNNGSNDVFFIEFDLTDLDNVQVTYGTEVSNSTFNIGSVANAEFAHIAVVANSSDNEISLYVNGVAEDSLTQSISDPGLNDIDFIVKVQDTSDKAYIKQLVVYSVALVAADVEELFNLGENGYVPIYADIDLFGRYLEGFIQDLVGASATVNYQDTFTDDLGTVEGRKVVILPMGYAINEPIDRSTDTYDARIGIIIYERYTDPATPVSAIPAAWSNVRKRFVEWLFDKLTNARILYDDKYWSFTGDVTTIFDYNKYDSHKVFWSEMELTYRKLVPTGPSTL